MLVETTEVLEKRRDSFQPNMKQLRAAEAPEQAKKRRASVRQNMQQMRATEASELAKSIVLLPNMVHRIFKMN